VPKCKLPKSIPLHAQRINCRTNACELEEDAGGKGCAQTS
jgi:hypothetical protein